MDTTRRDRIGVYGSKNRTPGFDSLAERGVLLERAVTPAPLTWPAHCSLFTGLYPLTHRVRDNGTDVLEDGFLTLAEILRGEGYFTAAFVGSSILDHRLGADQGFDYYGDLSQEKRKEQTLPQYRSDTWWDRPASRVNDEAIRVLKGAAHPFFAWCHYFDPHSPYQPPSPYDVLFSNSPYDGEVAAMDVQLKKLVAGIESIAGPRGLLIVVLADHGECLGEYGGASGHAELLYEEILSIPAVIAWPKHLPEGVLFPSLFRMIDFLPTLLEMVKIEVPQGIEGVSRVDDLLSGKGGPEDCFHETCSAILRTTSTRYFAYRSGDRKILWREGEALPSSSVTDWKIGGDRFVEAVETEDSTMTETLRSYIEQSLVTERSHPGKFQTDEMEDAMRSLGYLR